MAETSTIFGFMKYVSATDILSDFKKTVDSHFVNSLRTQDFLVFLNTFLYSLHFSTPRKSTQEEKLHAKQIINSEN